MITPGFALTATERVLPKLALDFTTASLDPRITFTRALNTATVTNSSGYVVPINADLPRFDYNPLTLVCKGLLIEESRTNLQTYSSDFTNGIWTKAAVSVAVNATTAPDGTVTSNKIVEDSTLANHRFYSGTLSLSGTNTASIYLKAAGRNYVQFGIWNSSTGFFDAAAVINLTDGSTSSVSGTVTVTNVGNSWYRCTATGTYTTANRLYVRLLASASVANYQGDGVSGVFAWGAQLEAGAFPTSYIPTTSAALTRNADNASMTGTNFSDWYNQSEGTFFAQADALSIGTTNQDYVIQVGYSLGGLNDGINCGRNVGGVGGQAVTGMWQRTSGTNQALLYSANNVVTVGTPYKLVGTYKNNSYAASINGAAVLTDTSGTVTNNLDTLSIGKITAASTTMSGHVQKISYWPQRLTNAEVQAFAK